jgi:hypothetical protein
MTDWNFNFSEFNINNRKINFIKLFLAIIIFRDLIVKLLNKVDYSEIIIKKFIY